MAKINGCLVAGACLKYFFGWSHCEHKCDEEHLDQVKDDIFEAECKRLRERVAPHYTKKLEEKLKPVYFSQKGE